ncbi:iron-siderophore ABC transporter substrate-binding protein [Saccharomonospora sp. NB11]|jgi:iron complex transport system substrate-binding protein|uniref:iron-siderophore ABC transporter substrate-binding protein n=1 Tax=Saccharomonospora sp. NB11 TaxID=1642298 RepID=UPI0018D1C771|nr:iron-siderophore ABC transporter substrate-binding protein [Saccharomonospora sp. NB11]
MTATRRGRLRALLAAALLALTACSSGDRPSDDAAHPAVEPEPGALPVTIEHRYGSTTVTDPPSRVVSVGYTDHDALLALGVVPVATTRWFGDYPGAVGPWARDALDGSPVPTVLDDTNGIPFEKIATLEPDLIVGVYSDLTREEYDVLSEIAPTIAPPPDRPDFGASWRDVTTTVGRAVGRPAEARRLVADVDRRLADVRAEHPDFQRATAVVAALSDGYFLYGPSDPRTELLVDVGLSPLPDLAALVGDRFGASVGRENADVLDTDVVVWLTNDGGAELRRDPLYNTLRTAKEGREVLIDNTSDFGNAFSQVSVTSIPYVLDRLVPKLEAALDGDPATTG